LRIFLRTVEAFFFGLVFIELCLYESFSSLTLSSRAATSFLRAKYLRPDSIFPF